MMCSIDTHYKLTLISSLLDDTNNPLFVVEFDGDGHSKPEAQKRGKKKNELCRLFKLSLLRINQKYLSADFSNWDLLRWFCTVFLVKQGWDQSVESGEIPYEDSIFDPMFVSVTTKSGARSLELESVAQAEFGQLFRDGKIPFHVSNWITARDGDHVLRAIAWISTSKEEGVIVETAMQHHRLGDWVQFAVRGIILDQLVTSVHAVLDGIEEVIASEIIDGRVEEFKRKYETIMAFGVSRG